jgi:hypothetical protein
MVQMAQLELQEQQAQLVHKDHKATKVQLV